MTSPRESTSGAASSGRDVDLVRGDARLGDQPGHTEVGQQRPARALEQHVGRAHVAVHHPGSVQPRERPRDRRQDRDRLPHAEVAAPAQRPLQRPTLGAVEDEGDRGRLPDQADRLVEPQHPLDRHAPEHRELAGGRCGVGPARHDLDRHAAAVEVARGRPDRAGRAGTESLPQGVARDERCQRVDHPATLPAPRPTRPGVVHSPVYGGRMATDAPTILATSGGYQLADRTRFEFAALVHHAVELSGATVAGRGSRHLGTAGGDQRFQNDWMHDAARVAGYELTNLNLFPMPSLDDVEGHLLEQDVVWVNGGSVANLLAVWRRARARRGVPPGLGGRRGPLGRLGRLDLLVRRRHDRLLRPRAARGDRRAGVPAVRQRRPLRLRGPAPTRSSTASSPTARCPTTHCTDDGVGLVYRGTELVEAVAEVDGKGAYVVSRDGDGAVEERLEPRRL